MAVFRIDRFAPDGAAANALRARVATFIARRPERAPAAASLVRVTEYGLVGAIGVSIGILFWLGLGPLPQPAAAPAPRPAPVVTAASTASVNPFGESAPAVQASGAELVPGPDLAETTLNLTLHGTWIDASGGTAIIKTPDDKQGRFTRGAQVWENVTLERVFRDQVVINRDGVLETLSLVGQDAKAPEPQAGAAKADEPASGEVFATLGSIISVLPENDNVGGVNLVLEPGDDYAAFLASGLRPGDVLVAVDGQVVGKDIGADIEYLQTVAGRNKITVNVNRGGVVTPIEIDLKGASANGG